jgi:hypothetical protein
LEQRRLETAGRDQVVRRDELVRLLYLIPSLASWRR